jgi:hypothetical protein
MPVFFGLSARVIIRFLAAFCYNNFVCCYTHMEAKNRKLISDLSERFQINNGYFLDKALVLLKQFQSGSVFKKRKKLKSEDIKGLKPADIHFVVMNLNDVFQYPVIHRADTYSVPNIDNNDPTKMRMDFVYENTEYLETAIALLEFIKAGQDKRLTLLDGEFYYRDRQFKLRKNSNLYLLLKSVFRLTAGHSGIVEYRHLLSDLHKNGIFTSKNDKQIKQLIYRNLTLQGYELSEKIETQFQEVEPLFKTTDEVGLQFMNDS